MRIVVIPIERCHFVDIYNLDPIIPIEYILGTPGILLSIQA